MKAKPIYSVYCTSEFGHGLQPVKANSKKEARKKFLARFKKQRIISIEKDEPGKKHYIQAI